MASLKELQEKRFKVGKALEELRKKHSADRINEHAGWESSEDRTAYGNAETEYDELTQQVQTAGISEDEAKKIAARFATIAELQSTHVSHVSPDQVQDQARAFNGAQELAFQGYSLSRSPKPELVTDRHRAAMRAVNVQPNTEYFPFNIGGIGRMGLGREISRTGMALGTAETRAAMGVSVETLGGVTVPEGFVASLEYALRAYGGIRNVATIMRTETAQPLPWPTIADTTPGSSDPIYGGALINVGELLGENVATSLNGTPPAMGAFIFGAQKFSSKLIQISAELERDSAFNLSSVIGKIMGERIGRIMAQKYATGSGNGIVPRGILNAVPTPPAPGSLGTGYTTASSLGITFDDLSNLIFSVDPAYRAAPGAGFCLHDKMVAGIRLLKDGMGRYLWTAGSVTTGLEPRIWEYPYQVVQEFPYDLSGHVLDSTQTTGIGATTYASKMMTFGDHSKYTIREVGQMRVKRLVERGAEYDQVWYIAYMEADADLIDAGTHPVGAMAMHS